MLRIGNLTLQPLVFYSNCTSLCDMLRINAGQVKTERKNEELQRFYRLGDQVRVLALPCVALPACPLHSFTLIFFFLYLHIFGHVLQEQHEERGPDSQAEQPTLAKKKKKKQETKVKTVERPDVMETQAPSKAEERDEESSEEEGSDVDAQADLRWKRMRGLVGPDTSSDEDQPDSESMSDSDFDADDFAEVDDEVCFIMFACAMSGPWEFKPWELS